MWSYYGSKSKLVKLYPKPKYDIVIEPFAGSAWYSVLNRDKSIILNEKYELVYNIWRWLINDATSEIILNNKDFYVGQDISQLNLAQPHLNLIGFCINRGSSSPCNIVQKWSCQVETNPTWASTTSFQLTRIANLLSEIKHWQIRLGDYRNLPDLEATWFIDPPYQYGGKYYRENLINYTELAEWCKSRKGQIIVCENSQADWLEFIPLTNIYGQKNQTSEVVWLNNS